MTTATIRPNADVYTGYTQFSAGTTAYTLLSDDSDATYIKAPISAGAEGWTVVDLATTALPAGSRVVSVTPRIRSVANTDSSPNTKGRAKLILGSFPGPTEETTQQLFTVTSSIATYTLSPYPTAFGTGIGWTQTDIDGLRFAVAPGGTINYGAYNMPRIHELYVDVDYVAIPTVTVSTVTTTTTTTPTISWLAVTTNGVQTRAEVKIFNSVTYGGGGFSADTSTPDYSTTISTSASSIDVPPGYLAAGTYRAYVKISQTVAGSYHDSAWANNAAWVITLDPPGVPTLTVTADSANFRAGLVVQGHENILSEEDASLEGGTTGGWAGATNCTITNSTTQAIAPGTRSLRLSSSAAGNMSTRTASGTGGRPVVEARAYRARASFRAGATTRSARVDVIWYDTGGSVLSTSTGATPVSATSGAFVEAVEDFTAPTNATYAALVVNVLSTAAANELFYMDHAAIQETAGAAPSAWSRGGLVGSAPTGLLYWHLEYSDDTGTTWADVYGVDDATPGTNQLAATVYDRLLTPGVTRQYRVLPYYTQSSGTVAGSTVAGSTTVNLELTTWRLTDFGTGTSLAVTVMADDTKVHTQAAGVFDVLGATTPIVVKDVRKTNTATLTVKTMTSAARTALLAVLDSSSTLLLQGPSSQMGGSRFVEFFDATENRPDAITNPYVIFWQLPYVEVATPVT